MVSQDPNHIAALLSYGHFLETRGEPDLAEKFFLRARDLSKNSHALTHTQAETHNHPIVYTQQCDRSTSSPTGVSEERGSPNRSSPTSAVTSLDSSLSARSSLSAIIATATDSTQANGTCREELKDG